MVNKRYEKYINSPAWRTKRQERLELDGNTCKKCRSRTSLHVHHRTYARFGGGELLTDLVTLCETCHGLVHEMDKKQKRISLDKVTGNFLHEVVVLKAITPPKSDYLQAQKAAGKYHYFLKRITKHGEKPAKYRLASRQGTKVILLPEAINGLTVEQIIKKFPVKKKSRKQAV